MAWRRTTLSLIVAAVVVSRLAIVDSVPAMVVISGAAAFLALWVAAASLRRRRWSAPSEREPEFEFLLRDGRLPALLAGVATSLCLVVLALSVGLLN